MIRLTAAPLHDWKRHHPLPRLIAADVRRHPPLLALRTRTLVADVRRKYGVCQSTAMQAVTIARAAA